MLQTIRVGDITIAVTRKRIQHVHLRVLPPDGRVTISAPMSARLQVVEAFVATRLAWIRRQQDRMRGQPRVEPKRFVSGESHDLWGCPKLLSVVEREGRPYVTHDEGNITLFFQPGSDTARRAHVM